MPCYDGSNRDAIDTHHTKEINTLADKLIKQGERLDLATRMVCSLMRRLQDADRRAPKDSYTEYQRVLDEIPGLNTWWAEHIEMDNSREKYHYERIIQSLSEEDLDILHKFGLPTKK
jgi:polyhydroxyalkanoate synthesis regulator phasin